MLNADIKTVTRIRKKGVCWFALIAHYRNYLTAGTIFQNSNLPLRKWFLAMHLLTRDKQGISAIQLMRDLSVSYETAWTVKQKPMVVMEERVHEKSFRTMPWPLTCSWEESTQEVSGVVVLKIKFLW